MLKLTQWAYNFASAHFGTPEDDFGSLQRFIGVMVSQMQGQYAMKNLLNMDDGL